MDRVRPIVASLPDGRGVLLERSGNKKDFLQICDKYGRRKAGGGADGPAQPRAGALAPPGLGPSAGFGLFGREGELLAVGRHQEPTTRIAPLDGCESGALKGQGGVALAPWVIRWL